MIELRWFQPEPSDLDNALYREPEKTLQWRVREGDDGWGEIWGDWQDVPTVHAVWTGLGDK